MKSALLLSLLLLGIQYSGHAQTTTTDAGGLTWHTDISKARALSDASKKPIFGFFHAALGVFFNTKRTPA